LQLANTATAAAVANNTTAAAAARSSLCFMAVSTFGADGAVADDAGSVRVDERRMALRAGDPGVHALELEAGVAVVVEGDRQPAFGRGVAAVAVGRLRGEL